MINKIQKRYYFLILSSFIIIIDQITKYSMLRNYKTFINKDFIFFKLDLVKNYGAAFNIFSGSRIFLSIISIIISIIFIRFSLLSLMSLIQFIFKCKLNFFF